MAMRFGVSELRLRKVRVLYAVDVPSSSGRRLLDGVKVARNLGGVRFPPDLLVVSLSKS